MNDDLALSRLFAGDLPDAEAAALRRRLATEPALSERYAVLRASLATLSSLPKELAPPRVPAALTPPAAPRSRLPWLGLPLLALAAALPFALRTPPPQTLLLRGDTVIDGRSDLVVAGLDLAVDGRVRVRVEPPPGALREMGTEIVTMDRSHLAAAFVGSLVTITVYEGTARLTPTADTPSLALTAGQSESVRVGGEPARVPAGRREDLEVLGYVSTQ